MLLAQAVIRSQLHRCTFLAFLIFFPDIFWGLERDKLLIAEALCHLDEDFQIRLGLPRRIDCLRQMLRAALTISIDAFFLHPQGSRQDNVSQLGRARWMIRLRNDHERLLHARTVIFKIRQRLSRIRAHDPKELELAFDSSLEHRQRMITRLARHPRRIYAPNLRELFAMLCICHQAVCWQDMRKTTRLADRAAGTWLASQREGRIAW